MPSPFSNPTSRRRFLDRCARAGIAISGTPLLGARSAETAPVSPTSGSPNATPIDPGRVATFPGPWQFFQPKGAIILVSDQQLDDLTDPDREVDLSLSGTPQVTTLRRLCAENRDRGARTLILAFDEFWSQYRKGQGGKPRRYTPDTDASVERVAKIGAIAKAHGLGLELSLLSPLEIGAGYARQTGESGRWVHFREGWRDPLTGHYSVGLWEQLKWTNNKGTIELRRAGVRVFAFRERRVGGTRFYAVAPSDIVELPTAPELDSGPAAEGGKQRRLQVRGSGDVGVGAFDRVLVVVRYDVPEMDYFSPRAAGFLEELVRRHHAAGIPLNGLYADEMHIQQDWGYSQHHEEGQFALRYLTPNLAKAFASRYGAEFADLEKYLVYFVYGQHGFLPDLQARLPAQHVMGASPEDVQRTWLLRRRYYQLLHDTVVELFASAKAAAEKLYGHELEARAHATWAQSPTIDFWNTGGQPHAPHQYEYTPDFLWSNTVQQAASACSDYFKWNEFLTGGGNDHAEGGWSDRNYYGLALACSTGSLNRVPNAYAAAWGMPGPALQRHRALENAFGCSPDPAFAAIGHFAHREVPVLMLYPSSLVACDERFGSWMVQYGYANYVTPEKFLEHARPGPGGTVDLAGRVYSTIVVLFEPLPPTDLIPRLEAYVESGGRLVWSGPPPRWDLGGQPVLDRWRTLCGIGRPTGGHEGLGVPGQAIRFEGSLAQVPPQLVLTDFLVDRIWPVPGEVPAGTEIVARCAGRVVGTRRRTARGGSVAFLGFRPRDDQAASLGEEARTWFDVLRALGGYATDDDPSVVSRSSPYLATRFPNGTISVCAHYRHHVESWPGGFHRDEGQDRDVLKANPLPSGGLELLDFRLAGHRIDYQGEMIVMFRLDAAGRLEAFAGHGARRIRLNGREHEFADRPLAFVAWAPLAADRKVPGGAAFEIWVQGEARLRIPVAADMPAPRLHAEGRLLGSIAPTPIPGVTWREGWLEFDAGPGKAQGHLYLIPGS